MSTKVKTWRVTTHDGIRFVVSAPTKRLAVLGFRHRPADGVVSCADCDPSFAGIRSVGLLRDVPNVGPKPILESIFRADLRAASREWIHNYCCALAASRARS
jgi:hypothetical protein